MFRRLQVCLKKVCNKCLRGASLCAASTKATQVNETADPRREAAQNGARGSCRVSWRERMKETEAETQQSQGTKHSQCVPKGWVTGSSTFSASAFKRTSEVLTLISTNPRFAPMFRTYLKGLSRYSLRWPWPMAKS